MFSFLEAAVVGSSQGRIYATTAKPYYVSGEMVTGNIVCEARTPISASGIDLKISGYEKTEWHDQKHRTEIVEHARPPHGDQPGRPAVTRQIPVMHRHRGKKTFFSQNMRIYNIGGGLLAPGTYTFPFSYQLPENLPGSFHERKPMPTIPPGCEWIDHDGGMMNGLFADSDDESMGGNIGSGRQGLLAVVHYKLKITLDVNGLWMQDLYARVPLIIHPKLAQALQPAQQTLSQPVIVCCCINQGTCTVCARFDKLAYVAGEVADVTADINNDSSSNLTTRVTLRRYLTLKATTGQKAITEDIVQQAYEPVPEKTNLPARKMPLQLIGEKVKPTTSGDYVNCRYDYIVECGVSMGDDITLRMPVTIYMPQPPPIAAPSSPPPPAVIVSPQAPVMMVSSPQAVAPISPQVQMQMQMPPQQQQQAQMQQQQPQGGQMQVNMQVPGMQVQMQVPTDNGQPQYGSNGQPQYGSNGQPQYGSNGQPQYGQNGQPQYGNNGQPQYGNNGQPQYGNNGQPQYGSNGQPQYGQDGGMGMGTQGGGGMVVSQGSSSSSTHLVNGQVVSHQSQAQGSMQGYGSMDGQQQQQQQGGMGMGMQQQGGGMGMGGM